MITCLQNVKNEWDELYRFNNTTHARSRYTAARSST